MINLLVSNHVGLDGVGLLRKNTGRGGNPHLQKLFSTWAQRAVPGCLEGSRGAYSNPIGVFHKAIEMAMTS
jgi:hypothetical protein